MDAALSKLSAQLDAMAEAIMTGFNNDGLLNEHLGWSHPAVTRSDLAAYASTLAKQIKESAPADLSAEAIETVKATTAKIKSFSSSTIQYFYNGHGPQAIPAYQATIEAARTALEPLIGWHIPDPKTLPPSLNKKLRSINADLDQIIPDKEELKLSIKTITEATAAADALPIDLQSLSEARTKIQKTALDTGVLAKRVEDQEKASKEALESIFAKNNEAAAIVANCETAYSITTTKGLAASFAQKASSLNLSMWTWVVFLLCALIAGAYLGYMRLNLISLAIDKSQPIGFVWVQIALSVFSIGAPLWFAWLATKQIGQRFRLAEDYGFKAAVAKAYEGYRREAARIDPELEKRLFNSALTRLEEAPLRLVESQSHGGPWSEFLSSTTVDKALNQFPEAKDKIMQIAETAVERLKNQTGASKVVDETAESTATP